MRTFAGQGGTPTLPYAPALVRPGCLCESLVTSDELHGYGLLVLSARDVYMSGLPRNFRTVELIDFLCCRGRLGVTVVDIIRALVAER